MFEIENIRNRALISLGSYRLGAITACATIAVENIDHIIEIIDNHRAKEQSTLKELDYDGQVLAEYYDRMCELKYMTAELKAIRKRLYDFSKNTSRIDKE